jgi:hypothetical protein
MTDFDARLRERFQHLDASIPAVPTPAVTAPRRELNRRRQGVFLLVAAAVFLGTAAVVTMAMPAPSDPAVVARNAADEERVREDIGTYTADACLSRDQALTLFRQRLDALGLSAWTIRADDRIKEARCVTGAPIGDSQEILLIASMGGKVAAALDRASAALLDQCLGHDEAVALVQSTLVAVGVEDPKVEATGVRQVPVGSAGDAYLSHVAAGCFVYGGAQFDNVGRYTWFVSGR